MKLILFLLAVVFCWADASLSFKDEAPHVDPSSGVYAFQSTDWIVPGVEPIEIKRTYRSSGSFRELGGWEFWPQLFLNYKKEGDFPGLKQILNKDEASFPNPAYLEFIEPSGEKRTYYKTCESTFFTLPGQSEPKPAYAYACRPPSRGSLEGKENPLNNRLFIETATKNIVVFEANGNILYYSRGKRQKALYQLDFEIRPNGNKILYSYDPEEKLQQIRTTNATETKTYAWIKCSYPGKNEHIKDLQITTSDGQTLFYKFKRFSWFLLEQAAIIYRYALEKAFVGDFCVEKCSYLERPINEGCFLSHRTTGDGREWKIEYYLDTAKETLPDKSIVEMIGPRDKTRFRVKTINIPDGQLWIPLYVFKYFFQFPDPTYQIHTATEMICKSGKTRFLTFFDREHQITAQEIYVQGQLQSKQLFLCQNGYLKEQKLLVPDHTNFQRNLRPDFCERALDAAHQVILQREFGYDEKHNVDHEKITGDFSGDGAKETYQKRYEYAGAPFHLVTKIVEENGIATEIEYLAGTNLVASRFLSIDGAIYRRQFYIYDEDHLLTEEMEDDGLKASQKTYKRYILKKEHPALGFPESIEEGYVDIQSGSYTPLKRADYLYNNACKVICEKIYDCDGKFQYELRSRYNHLGRILEKSDPLGYLSKYTYDDHERIETLKESSSPVSKRFIYGKGGRLIKTIETGFDGLISEEKYEYDFKKKKITTLNSLGPITESFYDREGRLLHQKLPSLQPYDNQPEIHLEYDILGYLALEKQPDTDLVRYRNTISGNRCEIIQRDGTSISHRYNLDGSIRMTLLEDGTKIENKTDPLGRTRLKQIFSPEGKLLSEEKWIYNAYHLREYVDPTGNTHTYFYDGAGRKIGEEISSSDTFQKISYTYDSLGFISSTELTLPEGFVRTITENDAIGRPLIEKEGKNRLEISYDAYGNRKKTERQTSAGLSVDTYVYDSKKRLIKHTNPFGQEETFSYDDGYHTHLVHTQFDGTIKEEWIGPLGQVIERKTPSLLEKFSYDLAGRMTQQICSYEWEGIPNSYEIKWDYDKRGRTSSMSEGGKTTLYSYDCRGRLEETVKPSQIRLTRSYDSLDRETSLISSDGTVNYISIYDSHNGPIEVHDLIQGTLIQRKYRSQGECISETLPYVGTIQKTYDLSGRCTGLILPDRSSLHYHYNPLRIDAIHRRDAHGQTLYNHRTLSWDSDGSPLEEEMIGNLGSLSHKNDLNFRQISTNSPYFSEQIQERDHLQRAILIQNSLFGSHQFAYDSRSHLIAEKGKWEHAYSVDPLDNRRSLDEAPLEVTPGNRLKNDYDADGNLIHFQNWTFTYDALGRMLRAFNADGRAIHWTYDAFHRRLSKKTQQEELYFLYDGKQEIGAVDSTGKIVQFRALHPRGGSEQSSAIAIELNEQIFAPLSDLRGNIAALISIETKTLVESYSYSAFGEHQAFDTLMHPISSKNPWRYASKRVDEETQFSFFGRRYYSPHLGRWLTPDPSDFVDGPNLYAYVGNDPINRSDPNGLFSIGGFELNFDLHYISNNYQIGIGTSYPLSISIARTVLYAVGSGMSFASLHSLPDIPILKESLILFGRVLQMNFTPYESPLPHTIMIHSKLSLEGDHLKIIYVNGILNNQKDIYESKRLIRDITGRDAVVLYTESRGFIADVADAFFSYLGFATTNVRIMQEKLETYLRDDVGPEDQVLLILHSKGAILGNAVLKRMDGELKSKISSIYTFGPAKLIHNQPGMDVMNVVSPFDIVPFVSLFDWMHYLFTDEIRVKFTGFNLGSFSHTFTGKGYSTQFEKLFLKKYEKLH